MKTYFSHTGNNQYLPEIEIDVSGTLTNVIDAVNQHPSFTGIKNEICSCNKLVSGVRIFANVDARDVDVHDIKLRKYYENEYIANK